MSEVPRVAPLPPPLPGWRQRLARFLPLVIGAVLLVLILSRIDLARLGAVLLQVHWPWYALAMVLLVVNLSIISFRWRFNLGLLKLRYPYLELLLIDNAGALAGAATPGRMGDLARLIYFRQEKALLVRVGLSILGERLLDLLVLVWLAVVFLWVLPLPHHVPRVATSLFLAALLAGTGAMGGIWWFWDSQRLQTKLLQIIPRTLQARFVGAGQEIQATLQCYATWRLTWSVALTFLAWGVNILSAYCTALALALPLTLWQTGACFCLSTLFTLIPVSVAGIGTRELAMVYLFSCLGLPAEQALAFSFLLLGFLVVHSVIGFVALLCKPPPLAPHRQRGAVSTP